MLEGGVNVIHGERRRDMPFRVGISEFSYDCNEGNSDCFWTNDFDEAVTVFHLMIKRRIKHPKK